MKAIFIFLFGLPFLALANTDEGCCGTKTVGAVEYILTGETMDGPSECLSNCTYSKIDEPNRSFCFKAGNLPVNCTSMDYYGCVTCQEHAKAFMAYLSSPSMAALTASSLNKVVCRNHTESNKCRKSIYEIMDKHNKVMAEKGQHNFCQSSQHVISQEDCGLKGKSSIIIDYDDHFNELKDNGFCTSLSTLDGKEWCSNNINIVKNHAQAITDGALSPPGQFCNGRKCNTWTGTGYLAGWNCNICQTLSDNFLAYMNTTKVLDWVLTISDDFCNSHSTPDLCNQKHHATWKELANIFIPNSFSYICFPNCGETPLPPTKLSSVEPKCVPLTKDSCVARVNGFMNYSAQKSSMDNAASFIKMYLTHVTCDGVYSDDSCEDEGAKLYKFAFPKFIIDLPESFCDEVVCKE